MADFNLNLGDGKLWLPSDVVPYEMSSKIRQKFFSDLTYMEDLAQQLAAYALLDRYQTSAKPPQNIIPNLEIKRQSWYGAVAAPGTRFGLGFGGVNGVGHNRYASVNDDGFRAGLGQVYQYNPMSPALAQAQVEKYLQAKARVLQRASLQRLEKQNQSQKQSLPFQASGTNIRGFVRGHGGTGVFLPRVSTAVDVKKKNRVKKGEEIAQRQPTTKNVVGKHEMPQLSPEVCLPQDWTY